ncbi:MAG: T9SS type A sorting domain-containing protein [Bacteroidota bacterium]
MRTSAGLTTTIDRTLTAPPNSVTDGWLYFRFHSSQEIKVQLYDILGRQRKAISWSNQSSTRVGP